MAGLYIIVGLLTCLVIYLGLVQRAMLSAPPDAINLTQKRWTKEQMQDRLKEIKSAPIDVKKSLPPKTGRRYVVVGGSGLVGGWIVQHLLWRGEDPKSIRILDLRPPSRPEVKANNIDFITTNVADSDSVKTAFTAPWPSTLTNRPLTVFHCVAFIGFSERTADFLSTYTSVNIDGTRNVLSAAKSSNCTIFIATSSGSIAVKPPTFFISPFQRHPNNWFQLSPNADPQSLTAPLSAYTSCYAYSKAHMESLVLTSHTPGFATGCIRPAHAIYGEGAANKNSLSYDYLQRGGTPTWMYNIVCNFVHAQNVSLAHLCFEERLLNSKTREVVGGKAYCVTDPNPPVLYGDVYRLLSTLVGEATPVRFRSIPGLPILLLAYVVEAYTIMRVRWPGLGRVLPALKGDLALIQPAMFNMATVNVVYVDEEARRELGYVAPIDTLSGFCMAVGDWNAKVVEEEERERVGRERRALQAVREVKGGKDVLGLPEAKKLVWMGMDLSGTNL